jgi:hypothetical protein
MWRRNDEFLRSQELPFVVTQVLTVLSKQNALEMTVNKRLCTSKNRGKLVIPAPRMGSSSKGRNDGVYAAFPSENSRKISMLYLGNRHEKL